MSIKYYISILALLIGISLNGVSQTASKKYLEFYGDTLYLSFDASFNVEYEKALSADDIKKFYEKISASNYQPVVNELVHYRNEHKLDDWLYYQLIRKVAQLISPKGQNYNRYTLYKWFLLAKSGYDATLSVCENQLLFYIQCDENIYDIPSHTKNGKQYVCLNYHDYGTIDFEKHRFFEVAITVPEGQHSFSYKITQLPNFNPTDYKEKELEFTYNDNEYRFKLKLNPQVKNIFLNYPVVDYQYYLNAPLSKETYKSLIPALKKNLKGMSTKSGVDYLMRFTRYAFSYETDSENFGKEKRLSPEQTLLYENSDCEDRVALFFYLVKEIYNLPMIVLVYPNHVSIAVKFDKPIGSSIVYNGSKYSVCEPTPQKQDLALGQPLPELHNSSYQIGYVYTPIDK